MHDCLINGEVHDQISAADRGLAYGDGVFETLRVKRGVPSWWQQHISRLQEGCTRLSLTAPAQDLLLRELQTVSAGLIDAVVKITVTAGVSGRGYARNAEPSASRIVTSWPYIENPNRSTTGTSATICDTRLAIQPKLAGIKHLNRLEQVLASQEIHSSDFDEGLMLNTNDYVIEATAANLFIVQGGQMLTPRLDRCGVAGILREQILQRFKANSEQRRITLPMVKEADELFLCNSVRGVWPITLLDQQEFIHGPVTRSVQHWLTEIEETL